MPNAARCLVPYLLIPCLDKGNITPAEIILLPFTKTAPSCKGVSVANKFIKRSLDNCASIFIPEYKKSSGLKSLPKSTTIKAPFLFCESFPDASTNWFTVEDVALNSLGGLPSNTASLPVPSNSINRLSSPCHRMAKDREQASTTASINFEVRGRYAYL